MLNRDYIMSMDENNVIDIDESRSKQEILKEFMRMLINFLHHTNQLRHPQIKLNFITCFLQQVA